MGDLATISNAGDSIELKAPPTFKAISVTLEDNTSHWFGSIVSFK